MSTIHANTPIDCLSRIETCALLSGIDIPLSALRSQVASAIDVVVHTARLSDGSRKIMNVSEVLPLKNGEYATRDLCVFHQTGMDEERNILGVHGGTGELPSFMDEVEMLGLSLDPANARSTAHGVPLPSCRV